MAPIGFLSIAPFMNHVSTLATTDRRTPAEKNHPMAERPKPRTEDPISVTRKKFARLLKDYRERHRFTQEDAAKHLGVSVRTLQNWEIARNMPRGFGLRALVATLDKGRK
jgi:DNA-binding transcriptional regulator YiaG